MSNLSEPESSPKEISFGYIIHENCICNTELIKNIQYRECIELNDMVQFILNPHT